MDEIHEPLEGEPDLDAEGIPVVGEARSADGSVVERVEVPRSKWDNCVDLATVAGGHER